MTTKSTEVAVIESVETEAVIETSVTPYKAAKLVNEWLASDGIEKVLPPQMFYNYTTALIRKGKKSMIEVENGKITTEGLKAWYVKYTEKLAGKDAATPAE